MNRLIRRQFANKCEAGQIVKIGEGFHILTDVVKIPYTNQVFLMYAGEKQRTVKGVKNRLREVVELTGDTFVERQRQTKG